MTRRTKILATVAVVGALGTGTGAGLATTASARPAAARTLAATTPVTTASFSFTASISGGLTHGQTIAVTGTGQADLVNDAVSAAVNVPGAVARLLPGGSAAPEVVHLVLSGGTVYVEVPSLAALTGTPWISVALPSGATAALPGIFTKVGTALGDVNDILSFARSHHATVKPAGSSKINGIPVTGSKITATIKGTAQLTATVWADASDRLVQATVGAGGSLHKGFDIAATVNFSRYGDPVTITVPSPSQVKAIPFSLVSQLLGHFLHFGHHGTKPAALS